MEENNFDIEKIMNMVKVIQAATAPAESAENNDASENEFTEPKEGTPAINTIKAAIPYLDTKYQKNIGIMVKLIEIDRLINNFQAMSIGGDNDGTRKIKMLQAVKPQLDIKKQKMIDIFVRVMEIKSIMEGLANE